MIGTERRPSGIIHDSATIGHELASRSLGGTLTRRADCGTADTPDFTVREGGMRAR
jgi:hypothetical protein